MGAAVQREGRDSRVVVVVIVVVVVPVVVINSGSSSSSGPRLEKKPRRTNFIIGRVKTSIHVIKMVNLKHTS